MAVILLGNEHIWKLPFCRLEFVAILEKMLSFAKLQTIEVYLVSDTTIAFFNLHYMNCLGITNVLSFPMDDENFAGSIILSVDAVCRESLLYHQPILDYCLSLLSHGIAHIAGYTHGVEMDKFCSNLLLPFKLA